MTARDAGLSGSYNWSDASHPVSDQPSQPSPQHPQLPLQDPNSDGTMSATTVYHPSTTYYPPPQFTHDPSNPQPSIYRRPSHPGMPIHSNQCTPVPSATSFGVSEQQQQGQDNAQRGNGPAPPLPPSSSGVAQFNPALAQPAGLRTGTNTPISISQPHPRISTLSNPTTPIEPPLQLDIVNNPVGEIVTMLAAKLQNLITLNDRIKAASSRPNTPYTHTPSQGKSDPRLLSFHARNIPSITITAYLTRILKYCPTDPEVFISVLVYFDRIMRIANQHAQPLFGAYYSSYNVLPGPPLVHSPLPGPTHDDDSFAIDSFNVHRLVITTVAVATKFFSDQFYTNSRYARVGGLPLAELNHLEIQFLILLDFNLMIPPVEIQFYADNLLHYWIMEQQRQTDKAFIGVVGSQHQSTSEPSPMTAGVPFTPPTPSSTSSATVTYAPQSFHAPFRSQTAPQLGSHPMEGVSSTNTQYPPENQ